MTGLSGLLTDELTKAKIEVYDSSDKKIDSIDVMFNPSEYSISESVEYKSSKDGKRSGKSQAPKENFVGKDSAALNISLFFDTNAVLTTSIITSKKATDVSKVTRKFTELTRVKGEQHKPPNVKFIWGSLNFKGVIKDMKTTYTMFTETGMPVRAKMDLTIKMTADASDKFIEPFESPDRTKSRVISESASLWEIAMNEYGDVNKWRLIAKKNNVIDPLNIPPGTVLNIPAL